jgi:hypothetical protein
MEPCVARDLVEDRFLVLAPLHALITVQETIPHATAIVTTARIARRRSESTSKSPTMRMLAKTNPRATKNGVSTVTGPLDAIQHGWFHQKKTYLTKATPASGRMRHQTPSREFDPLL